MLVGILIEGSLNNHVWIHMHLTIQQSKVQGSSELQFWTSSPLFGTKQLQNMFPRCSPLSTSFYSLPCHRFTFYSTNIPMFEVRSNSISFCFCYSVDNLSATFKTVFHLCLMRFWSYKFIEWDVCYDEEKAIVLSNRSCTLLLKASQFWKPVEN